MTEDLCLIAEVQNIWAEDSHDANAMVTNYCSNIRGVETWDDMSHYNYWRDSRFTKDWVEGFILWQERVMRAYVARRKMGEKVSMRDVKKDIPLGKSTKE